MKKTMFITSVIMVIVMAIALTTSSLAWFSTGGTDSVTTNTFKVTAQGSTSKGIAISHDKSQWDSSISLSDANSTGLKPVVPFTGIPAATGWTAEALAVDTDSDGVTDAMQAVIDAFIGGNEAAYDADTSPETYGTATATVNPYPAKMIGAKIDTNNKFTSDVYRDGFYTDTLYLKNLAGGTSAANIKFNVDIAFGFHKDVDDGNGGTVSTYYAYTQPNRGNQYQDDAVLCVAVLARTQEFDTDANINDGETYTDPGTWEIIGYADSKGRANAYLGKDTSVFLPGKDSSLSYSEQSIATWGFNKINTEELRPERVYAESGETLAATIKTVKVIAWYDGATLNNNNSSKMDLEFTLTFNRKVYSGGSWVDPQD